MKNRPNHNPRKSYVITLLCFAVLTVAAFIAYLLTGTSFFWLASLLSFIASSWVVFHLCCYPAKPRPKPREAAPAEQERDELIDWMMIDDD